MDIHGYPQKICGYGYGYGCEISYPRQPCSFGRYRPLNSPLSCEVVQKSVFGLPFIEEGIPQILDMRFQTALT